MATNGTVFGIINCFGILYVVMKDHYDDPENPDPNVSFKTGMMYICILYTVYLTITHGENTHFDFSYRPITYS